MTQLELHCQSCRHDSFSKLETENEAVKKLDRGTFNLPYTKSVLEDVNHLSPTITHIYMF